MNVGQTMLHWQVGRRVSGEILGGQRAAYGERIIADLARALEADYGRGFAEKNLRRMVQFAEAFPDAEIVATLSRQLSWSQFVLLLPVKDALAREFYAEMCRVESWNVRTPRTRIQGMLFEPTSLSHKPEQLARQELGALRSEERMTPDIVFRGPYLLDFVGLRGAFSEKDLETALVRELGDFILEIGVGFTFVERQKRITVDSRDYYLDLLFYHRRLRRLAAVELKLGEFQAAHKGQMELYLRWLDKHERVVGEESPLGLILCAGKSEEHVELLEVRRSGIRVAQYLTELPPQEVLRERLHRMVRAARERHAALKAIDAPADGAPIAFRGLRHAPINEQGVVYLFGMVSEELGLIVEAVQSAYPDCEVKRCVDGKQNRWQRVRIEFEFRSSNFVEHGHDPKDCDMIVCWEHDWADCPPRGG